MTTPTPGHPTLASLCLALLLVLTATTGCSDAVGEPAAARPDSTETVSLAAQPMTTQSEVGHVYGRLPKARRAAVRSKVTAIVDAWWEAAFLAGTYPRGTFSAAFPGFTPGAEAMARRDKRLMSNLDIGRRIDSVTAKHRRVSLDVLAVKGSARSVTARFVLRFRTTGEKERLVSLRGRLFLTHRQGGWRVFGYDVVKGASA